MPFYELGWTRSNDYSLVVNFILRNTIYIATLFIMPPENTVPNRSLKIEHTFFTYSGPGL